MNVVDWSRWMLLSPDEQDALRRRYRDKMQAMANDCKAYDRKEQERRAAASKAIADRQRAQAGRR